MSSCPAAPTNGSPCLSSWKPGRLADEHQVGVGVADAEDHLGAPLRQPAPRAGGRLGRDLGERARSRAPSPAGRPLRRSRAGRAGRSTVGDEGAISRSSSTGRSSIAMWPAPSSTTRRPVRQRAGELHRRGRRRDAVVLPHHDQRRHPHARQRVAQIHLHAARRARRSRPPRTLAARAARRDPPRGCGASGPNWVRRDHRPARSAGLASTALRRRSTRCAAALDRAEPRAAAAR